jgi:hypothetical protein
MESVSRREFLVTTAAGSLATGVLATSPTTDKLPQKKLGNTGVMVPAIGLGTAPAGFLSEREAIALYHACMVSVSAQNQPVMGA